MLCSGVCTDGDACSDALRVAHRNNAKIGIMAGAIIDGLTQNKRRKKREAGMYSFHKLKLFL